MRNMFGSVAVDAPHDGLSLRALELSWSFAQRHRGSSMSVHRRPCARWNLCLRFRVTVSVMIARGLGMQTTTAQAGMKPAGNTVIFPLAFRTDTRHREMPVTQVRLVCHMTVWFLRCALGIFMFMFVCVVANLNWAANPVDV